MESRIIPRWLMALWLVPSSLTTSCGNSSVETPRADGSLADTKPSQTQDDIAPDLSQPADAGFDCSKSTDSYCVSVEIVMNGEASSLLCLPANKDLVGRTKTQFSFNCTAAAPSQLTFVGIGPEKGAGGFSVGFAEAQASDPTLELLSVTDDARNLILSTRAGNITDATLAWTESSTASYAGSFSGNWSSPTGSCSYFGYQCAQGTVRGTFKFTWQ
jgi:hypothetical protein